jgi:hypothetical protein
MMSYILALDIIRVSVKLVKEFQAPTIKVSYVIRATQELGGDNKAI